jgi:acyl-CoA thioesterase-2
MISIAELSASLTLIQSSEFTFRTQTIAEARDRIFGGLILGQASSAVMQICGPTPLHSLHGHFIAAGENHIQVSYEIEPLKIGRHFKLYRCNARQKNKLIFSMTASCHDHEAGFQHSALMPNLSPPLDHSQCMTAHIHPDIKSKVMTYLRGQRPFDVYPADPNIFAHNADLNADGNPLALWFKARETIPSDPLLHVALLAYLSDMSLLNAALPRHGSSIFDPQLQIASLDHALWFHTLPDMNDWLLYVQDSPWAGYGRALARGSLYNSKGQLLASSAQEGLARFKH